MAKITLDVKDENVQTIMNILTNLKDGLIKNIEQDGVSQKRTGTKYKPSSDRVVYESERPSGKYMSASAYKSRLKK